MCFRSSLFPCDAFEMQTFASFSGFFCVFRLFNLWGGQSFYPPLQRCSKSRALQQYVRAFQLVVFRIVLGSVADGISLLSCRNSCFLSWSTDREGGRWNTKVNATHSFFQRNLKIDNLRGACAPLRGDFWSEIRWSMWIHTSSWGNKPLSPLRQFVLLWKALLGLLLAVNLAWLSPLLH